MSEREFSVVVAEIINRLDRVMGKVPVRYEYDIHTDTQTLVVKIINKDTQEIIKTIPPEELLRIRARIDEIVGLIFDEER